MKVSELGEFGLVELIAKIVNTGRDDGAVSWQQLITGIGDDAAVWTASGKVQLATVDALVENIHFSPDYTPWPALGWKALAINLSDIAAMGGIPTYALISLGLPRETDVDDVVALYQGLLQIARQHGVAIAGGDTDSTPLISITITLLGQAPKKNNLLSRAAAQPGDLIAVTGQVGSAAAGFEMLSQKIKIPAEDAAILKQAFLRPVPRVAAGQIMAEAGIKAAIDISDGLVADLKHLCRASRTSARIEAGKIPIAGAVKKHFGERSLRLALTGGEDYELLFSGKREIIEKVSRQTDCMITVIGEITSGNPGEVSVVDAAGLAIKTDGGGWEHFINRD